MRKVFFLVILVGLGYQAFAQRGKQLTPLYVDGTAFQNKGWFVAPGFTYMLPEMRNEQRTEYFTSSDNRDTLYTGDFKRAGRIGLYLEAGRHHFIRNRYVLDHIDYGIHFKMLRGKESFAGESHYGQAALVPVNNQSTYSESFAGAFVNFSNILQLNNTHWIQNSLGLNLDYRVISKRNTEIDFGATSLFPETFLTQIHYRLGFGWKPEPGIFIMPMIETPLLTAYPWDDGKSTLQYFVGRNRPLIFTLRIQWLSKQESRSCENQPGKNNPDLDKKRRKKSTNSLFGDDAKKMKGIKKR
jgi:hypothetical protein